MHGFRHTFRRPIGLFFRSLALGASLCALAMGANAETAIAYPSKPIRLVVPAAPGGTSDILARAIGLELSKQWGQSVVVDNKPGADSNVGADLVAKAPADGYTLLLLDTSTLTMGPSLYPKLGYDPARDFAPITMLVFSPHVVGVHPGLPVKSIEELIAYAKSNPGKLNMASASNASRLAAALFNLQAGTDMLIVPYKGGAASINAVAGGEANVIFNGLLATLPHVQSGLIRGVAVASPRRFEAAPALPTVIEGGVQGFVTGSWQGLLAPAKTPQDIVQKLNAAVVAVMTGAEMRKKMGGMGADIIANAPGAFTEFLRADTEKWSKVVKDAGIKNQP